MPKTPEAGAQPTTQMKTETCVLCRTTSASKHGEHVWPTWYLEDCEAAGSPLFPYWKFNDEPITDRHGRPLGFIDRIRVQLPVCVDCNSILEKRFETPAKETLRRVFAADGAASLTADEAARVGAWFTKTLLLLVHPQIRYAHPRIGDHAVRLDATEMPPDAIYDWLVTGDPPPAGLSLWVHRADLGHQEPSKFEMPLPVVTADGITVRYLAFEVCTHGLSATLIVHPGWPIEHPLEAADEAVRLTPAPTGPVVLSDMPRLWPRTVRWLQAQHFYMKPGMLGTQQLPPLQASGMPFAAQLDLEDFVDQQAFI
jgi:hypothetical protein